jgi:TonB family protein
MRNLCKIMIVVLVSATVSCTASVASRDHNDASALSHADSICPTGAITPVLTAADSDFGTTVIRNIAAKAFYPEEAFKNAQQGRVVLCVRYDRDGHLDRALVQQSSGYPLLDGAALYATGLYAIDAPQPTARGGHSAPIIKYHPTKPEPVPLELLNGGDAIWLSVPVDYEPADSREMEAFAKANHLDTTRPDPSYCENDNRDDPANPDGNQAGQPSRDLLQALTSRIQKSIFFPPQSDRSSTSGGRADLRIILANGRFQCSRVYRSSGSPLFDGAILLSAGVAFLDPAQITDFDRLPKRLSIFTLPVQFVEP